MTSNRVDQPAISWKPRSALVLGGAGGLGAWLVEKVLAEERTLNVVVADIVAPPGPSSNASARVIDYRDGKVYGLDDIDTFDVVIVAVPRQAVGGVASSVLANVSPDALVVDVVSIKEQPLELIGEALPAGTGLIGTHPLFGPKVPSLVGQTVVVCPTARTWAHHEAWLLSLLSRCGGVIEQMTAAQHDDAMAIVQVLTHHTAFTVAAALRAASSNRELQRALSLLTPPFRALAGLVGRVTDLTWPEQGGRGAELFADIQTADVPKFSEVREAFVEGARHLAELAATGDPRAWAAGAEDVARWFKPVTHEAASRLFAQSHASAQADAVALHRLFTSQEVCGFRSTRERLVIAGRVLDYSPLSVELEVCSSSRRMEGGRGELEYGLATDSETRKAAARLGFAIPARKTRQLGRGEFLLLSAAEFDAWKAESLVAHSRDIALVLPETVNEEVVPKLLPRLASGVTHCELLDVYVPTPQGTGDTKHTVRVVLRGDAAPQRTLDELYEMLDALSIQVVGRDASRV